MGRLAGIKDAAMGYGQSAVNFAKENPLVAGGMALGGGALGYMAFRNMNPNFQPAIDQDQATQIRNTEVRGQGQAPPPARPQPQQIQAARPISSHAEVWQQKNQIPYIETNNLLKEQLRLVKERDNLQNDLALNQLYTAAAQNPGALR